MCEKDSHEMEETRIFEDVVQKLHNKRTKQNPHIKAAQMIQFYAISDYLKKLSKIDDKVALKEKAIKLLKEVSADLDECDDTEEPLKKSDEVILKHLKELLLIEDAEKKNWKAAVRCLKTRQDFYDFIIQIFPFVIFMQ